MLDREMLLLNFFFQKNVSSYSMENFETREGDFHVENSEDLREVSDLKELGNRMDCWRY